MHEAVMLTVDPLEKGEGVIPTHYVWRHVMTVPKFLGSFEYKYIVRSLEYDETSSRPHKTLCRWEDGQTRIVDLKSVKEEILLKNDTHVNFPSLDIAMAMPPQVVRRSMPPPSDNVIGGAQGSQNNNSIVVSSSVDKESGHNSVNLSMTSLNLSMDFLDGDDDVPPPLPDMQSSSHQPPSPVGLSFLRPASSPHDGSGNVSSPSRLTWGNETGAGEVLQQVVPSMENDTEYQQKLLESAAENLLNA